ncbi:MAG TPA: flagellar hook-associated protein FlgK [Candidatus Acidoferrales bacterium]|nr:flagellar hook-associated protein FlgK [Candidatus Acidoferrales bacterium]
MSNLVGLLASSSGTLSAYTSVLQTVQNNVANASTPGYAKQRLQLIALPFDPSTGTPGGVRAGTLESFRDQYADQTVRQQTTSLGAQQQMVESLTSLQSLFDISGSQGVPKALNDMSTAFSAWAASPTNQATRQTVIDKATALAQSFQQVSAGLANQEQTATQQVSQTVDQVNQMVGQLRQLNKLAMAGNSHDAGLDAQVNSTLESLSQLADITATREADGSVTVALGGNRLLLAEDKQYQLGFAQSIPTAPPPTYPGAPANVQVKASDGADINSEITNGKLGALLHVRNQVLPSYLGDSYQPGDLNRMAKQFADRVNQLLTAGESSPGTSGVPLFTYDTSNDATVAQTISVDPNVTSDQLAASDPVANVSNGVALALSALASPVDTADKIDGVSYSQFFGALAGRVGGQLNNATDQSQVQQSLVAQAQSVRQQASGVSLDEEATILVEFQRAYQAVSKLITVLDQLTQTTIDMIP